MNTNADLLGGPADLEPGEELILRDRLALVRTKLANERTLFSYVRTSLYLLTAGIGILEFKSVEHLRIVAYVCLFFSVCLLLSGFSNFFRLRKRLKNYVRESHSSQERRKS